jgi:hypothetical protein
MAAAPKQLHHRSVPSFTQNPKLVKGARRLCSFVLTQQASFLFDLFFLFLSINRWIVVLLSSFVFAF